MKTKMIEVKPDTHKKAKIQSAQNGMTLKDYIDHLVKQDEKKLKEK